MTNPSPPIPYIHQPHMVHAAVIPNGETNQAEDDSEAEVTLHEAHDIRKAQILDNRNFHILSFLFNTLCSGIMPPSSLFRGQRFFSGFSRYIYMEWVLHLRMMAQPFPGVPYEALQSLPFVVRQADSVNQSHR